MLTGIPPLLHYAGKFLESTLFSGKPAGLSIFLRVGIPKKFDAQMGASAGISSFSPGSAFLSCGREKKFTSII
jgi:hypothetical protein